MRSTRIFILLLSALLSTASDVPAADLTSVGQIRKLAIRDYAAGLSFDVSGLVTCVEDSHCLIDENGSCASLWLPDFSVRAGQVIRATGFTELNAFAKDPALIVTNLHVVGHGVVPEARLLSHQDIQRGDGDYRIVRVRGFLTDVFNDDVDRNWLYAILNMEGRFFHVAFSAESHPLARIRELIDTDIELTGECLPRGQGKRKFLGRNLLVGKSEDAVRILSEPARDAFAAPPLENFERIDPEHVHSLHRRKVSGRVLASYSGRRVLLAESGGRIVLLRVADGERLPPPGSSVEAIGFPETDFYNINLSGAHLRTIPNPAEADTSESAKPISPQAILHNHITQRIDTDYHGKTIRLRGIVRTLSGPSGLTTRFGLECDRCVIPVDISAHPETTAKLQIGCEVDVTGICVLEADNWNSNHIFPTIREVLIVTRTPEDIKVISRPPWWTPRRFAVAVGIFLAILTIILIWNAFLRKLVERRSRELIRAQAAQVESELRIDERTRIASELHDYLAQNLTAVSYKLTSARAVRDSDPDASDAQLETAVAMLDSSRTELRRCLWDLRSKALEEPTFGLAIRRSLQQVTDLKNVNIAFDVPRARVSDPTAHAILSVIRELVANAVNHGLADRITIQGRITDEFLDITVEDNGQGFDISATTSPDDGHFGLDGIRQRVNRLNGAFEIVSKPSSSTRAAIRIPLHANPTP